MIGGVERRLQIGLVGQPRNGLWYAAPRLRLHYVATRSRIRPTDGGCIGDVAGQNLGRIRGGNVPHIHGVAADAVDGVCAAGASEFEPPIVGSEGASVFDFDPI